MRGFAFVSRQATSRRALEISPAPGYYIVGLNLTCRVLTAYGVLGTSRENSTNADNTCAFCRLMTSKSGSRTSRAVELHEIQRQRVHEVHFRR